jgi:hypothetical protein
MAYCETVDIEKPEINELEISIEERKRLREEYEYNKKIDTICFCIFAITFALLCWNFLDYIFDDDSDFSDFSSDTDELPEVKEPPEPYVQGPGHHFFVRDMGIRYDDDLYSSPGVDVTKTNLYDPKDGPIQVPDIPKYDLSKPFPRSPFDKTTLDSIPETLTPKSEYEFIVEEINVDE